MGRILEVQQDAVGAAVLVCWESGLLLTLAAGGGGGGRRWWCGGIEAYSTVPSPLEAYQVGIEAGVLP